MHTPVRRCLLLFLALQCAASVLAEAPSALTIRLDDPKAVYLESPAFDVHGDGIADDSVAIQKAIDKAAKQPLGGYCVRAVRPLPADAHPIRLGRGAHLRVWSNAARIRSWRQHAGLPGRHRSHGDVLRFSPSRGRRARRCAFRPGFPGSFRVPFPPPGTVPPNDAIGDASPGTFYSAMSNIDFEIGAGNPAAVAIRAHYAQHCFLRHMDFHIGSGLAALTEIGNEAEDLRFYRGNLRHPDRQAFGSLAVHTDRFDIRRTAQSRHPRA